MGSGQFSLCELENNRPWTPYSPRYAQQEQTSTHERTMLDGWCVNKKTNFHCILIPLANHDG
jgi:hypothetical protein